MTMSNEGMEVLPLEKSAIERVGEFLPPELQGPFENTVSQLEKLGLEVEPIFETATEFGEAVLNEGLDVAREYVNDLGQLIAETGVLERVGEFAPALQKAFEAAGRAIVGGLENVNAGDVATLLGIALIAYLAPEAFAVNPKHFIGKVNEISTRVLNGAHEAAGASS
jgi:hypothetical protein